MEDKIGEAILKRLEGIEARLSGGVSENLSGTAKDITKPHLRKMFKVKSIGPEPPMQSAKEFWGKFKGKESQGEISKRNHQRQRV